MRTLKRKMAGLLAVLMFVSTTIGASLTAEAVWYPDHVIPAYQQKNIFETETVKFDNISVEEVVNATISPMVTKPIEEAVTFRIYNSTTQETEQIVTSQNGKLPELNLKKDHNYIFFAEDSTYRMQNAYVWVKGKVLVDIKNYYGNYDYPIFTGLRLYKRSSTVENPLDDRRVTVQLPILTEGGAPLYNVNVRLISEVETRTYNSGSKGRIVAELLEDVNYMVEVEHDTYAAPAMPLAVKDKSEYGAGKYSYDHSSCAQVENIVVVKKDKVHNSDSVISNVNYDEIYAGYYTNIAGKTALAGMNFKDMIVLEHKIKKDFEELSGKYYEVFDIKTVNPHRWEVAELAAGEFTVTKLLDEEQQVVQVYEAKNDTLEKLDFVQSDNELEFVTDSMALYPIVIEYDGEPPVVEEDPREDPIEEPKEGQWKRNAVGWWYEYEDGTYLQNTFQEIDGVIYYFLPSGYMATGWQKVDGHWYLLAANGSLQTGWIKSGSSWYYADPETGRLFEEEWLDDTYYFHDEGAMVTGWKYIEGDYYFFAASGAKVTNAWAGNYYLKADGKMAVSEWVDNGKSYVNASGKYEKGWLKLEDNWYYLGANGVLQTGWIKSGSNWYYADPGTGRLYEEEWLNDTYYFYDEGAMATGWVLIGGDYYYFSANGDKMKNAWIGKYYVGSDGKWIPDYK